MGGGGSIQGMNNSLNNNKKLLRKKSLFKKERSFLNLKRAYFKAAEGEINVRNATKEQLAAIRKKVLNQRRRENRILTAIASSVILLTSFLLYPHISAAVKNPPSTNNAEQVHSAQDTEDFNFYISEGDKYLKQSKWHNAVFQYKKAVELFPSEYDGMYRLAYAQVYRCRNTGVNCISGRELVDKLLKSYPDKKELIDLKIVLEFEE